MCTKTFYKESELDEHQQKLHAEYYQLKKTNTEMELEALKCHICGTQYSSRINLKRHMQTHTGNFKYRCDHCDTGFTVESQLKKHLITHTGEYPYRCHLCEKYNGFRQLSSYLKHTESRHSEFHKELLEKKKIGEEKFGMNGEKKFYDYMKSTIGVAYEN